MLHSKALKKFGFRFLIVNVTFFLVKLTMEEHHEMEHEFLNPTSLFYYITTFILFMVTWEFNDWLLRRQRLKGPLAVKSSFLIICKTMMVLVPLSAGLYYLGLFHFKDALNIICEDPEGDFITAFFRADLIGLTVIALNLFHYSMNRGDEMKKEMEDLKREVLASKYSSLKNQISPHFLFNSLNTMTALMYEDRDLASDFVTRLASSYRYILENREEDLVPLSKELGFLDSFIFMMNVRHKDAVVIKTTISVDVDHYLIPTLSLQMLVENALKHNFYSKESPLYVNITTVEGKMLSVKNNLHKRNIEHETTGLGLMNIKRRYAYYTNKPVLILNEEERFEVLIPLLTSISKDRNLLSVS